MITFKITINEITAKIDTNPITTPFVNKILPESTNTIVSAIKLFKKCAKIGTRILSVFKYKMDMQIAKINAAEIFP